MDSSANPVRMLQQEVHRLRTENQELKDELSVLRTSMRGLVALQDVINRLTPETDVLVLLDDVLASALAAVGTGDGSLLLVDEETDELVFAVVHGSARDKLTGFRLALGEGIAGWVAENRQPAVIDDVRSDSRFSARVDETFSFQTRSMAAVPLLDGDRVLGVIEAVNKNHDRPFSRQDQNLLEVVAQLAAIAIRRAESFTVAE
ncbi:MAG: GAF domain-containing protein [Anaerolineales bacterium]|nr:GAF domain-containing protein [Anaerolineales bacterium]